MTVVVAAAKGGKDGPTLDHADRGQRGGGPEDGRTKMRALPPIEHVVDLTT
jgi:hypothetical protein